ncbi:hypothetical protein Taro_020999 [Colocasia esculenta]|uniref:Uncharacterized protein n=1 Tax=Colocasia esculenta TaxID=4460 RepID=A0A843VA65_COLES|nr:hypothetical protein [Colocasia esculenta]
MEQYLEEKKASQKRPAAPFQRQDRKKAAFQSPQRPVTSGSSQIEQRRPCPTQGRCYEASPVIFSGFRLLAASAAREPREDDARSVGVPSVRRKIEATPWSPHPFGRPKGRSEESIISTSRRYPITSPPGGVGSVCELSSQMNWSRIGCPRRDSLNASHRIDAFCFSMCLLSRSSGRNLVVYRVSVKRCDNVGRDYGLTEEPAGDGSSRPSRPVAPSPVTGDDVGPTEAEAVPPAMSASHADVQAVVPTLSAPVPSQVPAAAPVALATAIEHAAPRMTKVDHYSAKSMPAPTNLLLAEPRWRSDLQEMNRKIEAL